jgi:hypothetical protein
VTHPIHRRGAKDAEKEEKIGFSFFLCLLCGSAVKCV